MPAQADTTTEPPAAESPPHGFGWMVLGRHGRRPLGFNGRLLFEASNRAASLPVCSDIAVFETPDEGFVAVIRHVSEPPGLLTYADALLCDSEAAVREAFAAHRPQALLPVELLLPEWADGAFDETVLATARGRAQRLREGWQSLLAAVFGPLDLVTDADEAADRGHARQPILDQGVLS